MLSVELHQRPHSGQRGQSASRQSHRLCQHWYPPFALFHGDSDPIVPLRHSKALRDALQKAKVPVTLTVLPRSGHGFHGRALNQVGAEVLAFFDKHLKK